MLCIHQWVITLASVRPAQYSRKNMSYEELFCLFIVSERGAWVFFSVLFFPNNQINRRVAQQRAIIFHESGWTRTWICCFTFTSHAMRYLEGHLFFKLA